MKTQDDERKYNPISMAIFAAIGISVLIVLIIWGLTGNNVHDDSLMGEGYYDKISDTVVDTYSGDASETKSIYGIQVLADAMPATIYGDLNTQLVDFLNFAYPDEQFSYRKNSVKLTADSDEENSLEVASNKYNLKVNFTVAEDKLTSFRVLSGNQEIYHHEMKP